MNPKQKFRPGLVFAGLALWLILISFVRPAYANVYATNIRLNGATNNASLSQGSSVTIGYILNEPASLGVTISITSGSSVVRRINLPGNGPGTFRGTNTVVWDGRDDASQNVSVGTYSVTINPATSGYTTWTQITSDSDPGAYVYDGMGIAVDRNPQSLFYGRVFVANAADGLNPGSTPGDRAGILKLNADASPADEGESSAGTDGHTWAGQGLSPWKVEVSDAEVVYASDLINKGEVFSWGPTLSSSSLTSVLRTDNNTNGATLTGLAIVDQATNTEVWMSDSSLGLGVLRWAVSDNGTCATNDPGTTAIAIGSSLTLNPTDLALDHSGNAYVIQSVTTSTNPTPRVFRFPAYDPATNGGIAQTLADWAIGASDDTYGGASGVAVDPTGTYVAVSFQGILDDANITTNGNTKVFFATNGALVANLDLGLAGSDHQDTDCAWDAVGNVYYIDNYFGVWRAVSPPGTNQSTTVAIPTVQVQSQGGSAIQISGIVVVSNLVTLSFAGSSSDTPSSFTVLGSVSPNGAYSTVPGATIVNVSPGLFQAIFPLNGATEFYQVQRYSVASGITITRIAVSGGVVTLNFTGASGDPASAFRVLNSSLAAGPYTPTSGATISSVSPGVFNATLPTEGPMQLYRIQR